MNYIKYILNKLKCTCKSKCSFNESHHELDIIRSLKSLYELKDHDIETIGNILTKRIQKEIKEEVVEVFISSDE
jgi:hypothetical protein